MTHRFSRALLAVLLVILLALPSARRGHAQGEPSYYALLIGQSYAESDGIPYMPGSLNDVSGMTELLCAMDATPYAVTAREDLTAEGMLDAFQEAFGAATDQDICLFYYAGHGFDSSDAALRGALVGVDGGLWPLPALCEALSALNCRCLALLDSCYAGNIVICLAGMEEADIHILCAAGPDDSADSITEYKTGRSYGVFTHFLINGSAFDDKNHIIPADRDRDLAISVMEMYYYIKTSVDGSSTAINPVVYPENSAQLLWGRNKP